MVRKFGCIYMTKKELIEDNMKLVYFLIHKYYPTFSTDEDITQAGMLGLCKAANNWNGDMTTFSTYASKCILSEICMEFRRRKKHQGLLSLDYETNTDDGSATFGDLIEGDSDIDFVDVEAVTNKLSPTEREVFALLLAGWSPKDITHKFGFSRQRTNAIMRKIRLVWRNYNGD